MSKEKAPPPPPEERHPLSQMVREIALALPDTEEDHPWGDIVFKVHGKMFAVTAPDRGGVCIKANPAEIDNLLQLPGVSRAAYVGRYGWLNVDFDDSGQRPFIEGLIHASYELIQAKARPRKRKGSTA